jgi:16S rRNA (guanine527-N7)-methyltransferase
MQPNIRYKLDHYHHLLLEWQKTINLVSPNTIDDAWDRHFEDSIQLSDFIDKSIKKLVDIGSGAGFPGLVLAIMNPSIEISLVESDTRKCGFLRHVSRETKCENVTIYNKRIDDVLPNLEVDCISARALSSFKNLLIYTASCWDKNKNLTLLLPKGQNFQAEINEAKQDFDFDFSVESSKIDGQSHILIVRNISSND